MASTHTATIKLDDGREVYLSYGVIVGAFLPGVGRVRTDQKFSVTTSRHTNQFVGKDAKIMAHDLLVKACKPIESRL